MIKIKRFWTPIILSILIITATASVLRGIQKGLVASAYSMDFRARWVNVNAILNGENVYQVTNSNHSYSFPSSLSLVIPYSLTSLDNAVTAWLITNLLFSALLFRLALTLFDIRRDAAYFVILTTLCGTPFRQAISNGQLCIVALGFFVLSLLCCRKGRMVLAGIFLSFALVKYVLIVPFVLFFFLLQKRWVPLVVCGVIHCVTHVWFSLLMKASLSTELFLELWRLNTGVNAPELWLASNRCFDIWIFFNRLNSVVNWGVISTYMAAFVFLAVSSAVLKLYYIRKQENIDNLAWLSLISVLSLFYTYHRTYDAVCLLFPALWITTFREFKVLRFVVGMGVGYFFIFQRILSEINGRGYADLGEVSWIIDAFFFYAMFYSIFRIVWLTRTSAYRSASSDFPRVPFPLKARPERVALQRSVGPSG